jgi:pilus assembly protein CpaE
MSNVLRLTIVDPVDATRDALKATLLSLDMVWLEAECSRYEFFCDVVSQTLPDVGIVLLDHNPEKALQLVEQLHANSPECSVIVISSSTDGNLVLRAMRAGVKEFLPQPVRIEDLVAALDRISSQRYGGGTNQSRGSTVIAIAGSTGGVGSTSLAVNLGCVLAADPQRTVALVDIDLCLGDADVFLDTIPDYSLVDVAQNVTRLDFTLLKRSLTKHASGLYLLPRPVQLEDMALITPDDLRRVIGLLKATFTHLIIDTSKGYSPIDMVALEMADQILLVTQLDLPCLRNTVRLMVSFGQMESIVEKIKIVVNRVGLDNHIGIKKAQETIGQEIFWQVPNDYRVMVDVRNNGVPLVEQAPKAAITQSVIALADSLCPDGDHHAQDGVSDSKSTAVSKFLNLWPQRVRETLRK